MDRNKTKFKYLLGVWKILPDYPKEDDIIYELSLYLTKDGRSNGEFSLQTLNSTFGSNWEKTKHGDLIKSMIEKGEFVESDRSTSAKKWYKIK